MVGGSFIRWEGLEGLPPETLVARLVRIAGSFVGRILGQALTIARLAQRKTPRLRLLRKACRLAGFVAFGREAVRLDLDT